MVSAVALQLIPFSRAAFLLASHRHSMSFSCGRSKNAHRRQVSVFHKWKG